MFLPMRARSSSEPSPVVEFRKTRSEASFFYRPVDHGLREIRLLRILPQEESEREQLQDSDSEQPPPIHCEIFHANLDDNPSYKALSYTWGDILDPRYPIYLDSRKIYVRENLWLALDRLRPKHNEELVIWVDALCIDQRNVRERNHQVTNMINIYREADEVLVWLGPSYDNSHLAFKFVKEVCELPESEEEISARFSEPDFQDCMKALDNLYKRHYWFRIWVVQEISAAKDIVLFCGQDSLNYERFIVAQKALEDLYYNHRGPGDLMTSAAHTKAIYLGTLIYDGMRLLVDWRETLVSKPNMSFLECLLHHIHRRSSDPKDMIYGLAAMANKTSKYQIKVDYSLSASSIYTELAREEISNSKKLDILTYCLGTSAVENLPSWVPDWSTAKGGVHSFLHTYLDPVDQYWAAGETEAETTFNSNENVILIKGIKVDTFANGEQPTVINRSEIIQILSMALDWFSSLDTIPGDTLSIHAAFARVLLCNRMKNLAPQAYTLAEWLYGFLGAMADYRKDLDPDYVVDDLLTEYWQSWVVKQTGKPFGTEPPDEYFRCQTHMRGWISTITLQVWDRQFFVSSSHIMGLAPQAAVLGDIFCIALGCSVPLVLRKVEDHYTIIGDAFVDGYMYGEALEKVDKGTLKLEEFELR